MTSSDAGHAAVAAPSAASHNAMANAIRLLAADAVQAANSGHPGMPMGCADIGAVLWLKYLRFCPKDPGWLGRDRRMPSSPNRPIPRPEPSGSRR